MGAQELGAGGVHASASEGPARQLRVPQPVMSALKELRARMARWGHKDFVNESLYSPSMHLLQSPGKQIRPGLIFTSAMLLDADPMRYVDLALAIELLHTASLVHDDIVDKDSTRRGRKSVHAEYGLEKAVLSGDALIAKAIHFSSAYGQKVVDRASEAAMDMCAGEVLDYESQASGGKLDINAYLRIAGLKSASLMAVSSSIVADHVGAKERDALHSIGYGIGLAFQIRDDIMNYEGTSSKGAADAKSDIRMSRPNAVAVFKAAGQANPVATAVKLSNFYIDGASALLYDLKNSGPMMGYLEYLKL